MKISYDELYAKLPDTIGRPVRVANPDPLHNNTKINDNGTYDVSSFAVANVNVAGEGGGDGNSVTPVLNLTVINNSAYNCIFNDNFICIENNQYLKYDVWNNPILPNQTKEFFVIPLTNPDDASDYSFNLPSPASSGVSISVSNTVNCVYDEDNLRAVITNLSEDASCTVTYE